MLIKKLNCFVESFQGFGVIGNGDDFGIPVRGELAILAVYA